MSIHNAEGPAPAAAPAWAWALALALATVVGTRAMACMTPLVALGVMAAATLPLRRAALTVGAVWLANQAIGFGLMHYPHDASTFAWGGAIGAATLLSTVAASRIAAPGRLSALQLVAAFALGVTLYEGALYAFAHVAGGLETFSPDIVARVVVDNGVALVALAAVHLLLTASAPRWFGRAPALRLA